MSGQVPEMPDVTLAVAGFWEAIGLNPTISTHNITAVYGDIFQRKTTGICFGMSVWNRGAPYGRNYPVWAHSKSTKLPLYENTQTDAMIEGFLTSSKAEEKDDYAEQITLYHYDEFAYVPLVATDVTWAKGDKVGNWEPATSLYLNLEYMTHAEPLGTFRLFDP